MTSSPDSVSGQAFRDCAARNSIGAIGRTPIASTRNGVRKHSHSQLLIALRLHDLGIVIRECCGVTNSSRKHGWAALTADTMPETDLAWAILRQIAIHLCRLANGYGRFRSLASLRAPWLTNSEIEQILDDVSAQDGQGRFLIPIPSADAVGCALGLTIAVRDRLKLRTIGALGDDPKKRKMRAKQRRRKRQAERRLAAGATPRQFSTERLRPWIASGVSRATWYRRKRELEQLQLNAPPPCAQPYQEPEQSARQRARVAGRARGAEAALAETVSWMILKSYPVRNSLNDLAGAIQ